MAHEKLYTAKQAATAVLEKVGEILKKSESLKTDLTKSDDLQKKHIGWDKMTSKLRAEGKSKESADKIAGAIAYKKYGSSMGKAEEWKDENTKKESATPSEHNSKDASEPADGKGPKGEIHPKEHENAPSDEPREQKDPQHNPKEEAEGNNELAGTTPTQVGQDGKNMPGGDEIKGHLKLAKFVGRMDYKRQNKQNQEKVVSQQHVGNSQAEAEAQHKDSLGKAEINSDTAKQKGIHLPMGERSLKGTSSAGIYTRTKPVSMTTDHTKAVSEHKQVLRDMKSMPKPKLPR